MKIEIEVDRDEVLDRAASRLYSAVRGNQYNKDDEDYSYSQDRLQEAVDRAARELIDEKAPTIIEEMLRPKIEELLTNGWRKTNQYGEPKGTETLTEYIRGQLTIGAPDQYSRRQQSLAGQLLENTISAFIKQEMGPEIEKFKKALRSRLDDVLKGKVTEAMRQAVGLR